MIMLIIVLQIKKNYHVLPTPQYNITLTRMQTKHYNRSGLECYRETRDQQREIDMLEKPNIGEYLIDSVHQNEGVFSMPDRFDAMILRFSSQRLSFQSLTEIQRKLKVRDNLKEWSLLMIIKSNNEYTEVHQNEPANGWKCICGHSIMNLHYVYNKINRNVLIIGSDCIYKFGNETLRYEAQVLQNSVLHCSKCKEEYNGQYLYISGNRKYCLNCVFTLNKPNIQRIAEILLTLPNSKYILVPGEIEFLHNIKKIKRLTMKQHEWMRNITYKCRHIPEIPSLVVSRGNGRDKKIKIKYTVDHLINQPYNINQPDHLVTPNLNRPDFQRNLNAKFIPKDEIRQYQQVNYHFTI